MQENPQEAQERSKKVFAVMAVSVFLFVVLSAALVLPPKQSKTVCKQQSTDMPEMRLTQFLVDRVTDLFSVSPGEVYLK